MKTLMAAVGLCATALIVGTLASAQRSRDIDTTSLTLGQPVNAGRVALVPILSKRPVSPGKYITLSQAIKEGLVEVVEIPGTAEVNALEVRNRASLPLLLVAGELLLGGKQDRIVAKDTIVPAHESRQVPVFCVEHGRWEGGKASFRPADTLVPDAVRSSAWSDQSQSEVWRKVAEGNAKAGAQTATGTVQGLLNEPAVARNIDRTAAALRKGLTGTPNVVGVICWLDGKIHSADLFANPDIFRANEGKLVRSYCADMVLSDTPRIIPVDMKACSGFLSDIVSSRRVLSDRSRFDSNYQLRGGRVQGYESGTPGFSGGLGGGFGGGGFGHGTYKPGGGR